MSLKELQLAAMLHDIGKFSQRAGNIHHEKVAEGVPAKQGF
ncbi:MAG: hypothetical protein QMD61_07450 [Methanobacterium sp.]|nr:hypothetical protein [Methanobacterium sp.]